MSLSVALGLGIAAVAIALWPTEQRATTIAQSVMPVASAKDQLSDALAQTGSSAAQSAPTRFANPFDASEVFEFPPGTTEEEARQLVAETLLQRARERGIRPGRVKPVHGHRSAALRDGTLMSKHF